MTASEKQRQRNIRNSLRALYFVTTGNMPNFPSRRECTHSLDQRHAVAFVKDPATGIRRPNLLAGLWHNHPGVTPELWLRPAARGEQPERSS